MHFVDNPTTKTVYVTEGAWKANIAHSLSGKTFVALAGVDQYEGLEDILYN